MADNVVNFKKALRHRKAEAKAKAIASAPPGRLLVDVLFEPGTFFKLDTCEVCVRTGRVVFQDAAAEEEAQVVFRNYGLKLNDYLATWPSIVGASEGINWAAKEIQCVPILPLHYSEDFHMYAEAFKEKDLMTLRRLAGPIGLLDKISAETDRAQRMVNVNEKPRLRTDARKNQVIAYLLGMQDPGGIKGSTLEQVQTALFALTIEADTLVRKVVNGYKEPHSKKRSPVLRKGEVLRSAGGAKLSRLGLLTLMDCPRPEEAAVLFHMERFAKAMDRSRLKHEWRALLGPFVGFDSNYGLLMESDLEWWRIENETYGSEWAGLPLATPATGKPAPAELASSKSPKVEPAKTDSESAPAPKARSRKSPQATLHVRRLLSKTAAKKLHLERDRGCFEDKLPEAVVEGVLTVGGHEFRMCDADTLGLVAFICGVTTVKAVTPSVELPIVMRSTAIHPDGAAFAEKDEKAFLLAFHRARYTAAKSRNQAQSTVKWWAEKRLAPALKLVPEHLQKNKSFPGAGD